MPSNKSRFQSLGNFITNKRPSGVLARRLVTWARARVGIPRDIVERYKYVSNENLPAALPRPTSGPLRINWVIPPPGKNSGGHLTIFRTINQLTEWGHQQHIYVVGGSELAAQATDVARKYYFPIKMEIEPLGGSIADSDALIATQWETAYVIRAIENTAQKFYFVQDLEYLFYPSGSCHEFAKQTYQMDYFGITAGKWIADELNKHFDMKCSAFGFSYDRNIYSPHGVRYLPDDKKRILFYARPETERRGFELGLLALAIVAKRFPDVEFVLVGFSPHSFKVPFRAVFPGVLHSNDLSSLYRSCHMALVLSHTNLSLLPLELMASGCPVVSNSGPNVEWFLTGEAAQLARPTPDALAASLVKMLEDEQFRLAKVAAGLALAESTNWTSEIKAVESALYRGLMISYENSDGE